MSTLAKDFNVGAVQGGHYQRMDVTLTWDSDVPMEFRLHMWQPHTNCDCEGDCRVPEGQQGITIIWSISRDLLTHATADNSPEMGEVVMADAWVSRVKFESGSPVAGADWTYLRLSSDDGQIRLGFSTKPLASFVRSSLAMCPTESEALDVDGLITQIFHAEEAQ